MALDLPSFVALFIELITVLVAQPHQSIFLVVTILNTLKMFSALMFYSVLF